MASSVRAFADLKTLGKTLKKKAEAERRKEAARRWQERETRREASLFRESMKDVVPLDFSDRVVPAVPRPAPVPRQRLADDRAVLYESISDAFDVDTLLETDADLSYRRDGIGPDVIRRLRRGHWIIQDELDLHGHRRDEARELLGGFLRRCVLKGIRCVRIIHGKGLGSVNQKPVLKKLVHGWLVQKEEVIAFVQARAADGGSGALLVLLKGK
ncbi:MAG: Smr/MutS family protein [Alistipes senegalensis]|nr:Smr/MutS family protein [Oxalobacter formigenes]MCM1281652.1 Smr/MutS family protein [Alistipes senegalensis]